jgi:hypothetical protein
VRSSAQPCTCFVDECGEGDMDPCPNPDDFADVANCDDACGAPQCNWNNCFTPLDQITALPAVFRTPAAEDACACNESQRRYMGFVFPYETAFRVSVPAPWGFLIEEQCTDNPVRCFAGDTPDVSGSLAAFFVVTDDATAPARNVLIEQVEPGTECPPE